MDASHEEYTRQLDRLARSLQRAPVFWGEAPKAKKVVACTPPCRRNCKCKR